MKKLAYLILFFSVPAYCDQVVSNSFKGLNSNENSAIIDPEYAQDLLNVDVTPGGKSIKKRLGYGLYKTLPSSQPIHGGFHSFDSSGNDVQLWGSSTSLYGIVQDTTTTQLVSSATLGAAWDCADTQGNSYCVNSARDLYLRTDGRTITWYSSPLGTMVESTPDRVVVAGVSGTPNTLYVSQSNTFTNFVTGVNTTDAFTEVIAAPGSRITNIRWGCGKLLWWKDQSFGYFDFDDQYVAQVKTVSDVIGTLENTSAIDPGGRVWFRGQDGDTWMYDCSALSKQSIDITPQALSTGRRVANSWSVTSSSDFVSGVGVWIDTYTIPGQVSLTGVQDSLATQSAWTSFWTLSNGVITAPFSLNPVRTIRNAMVPNLSNTSAFSEASILTQGNSPGSSYVGLLNSSSNGYSAVFGYSGGIAAAAFRKIVSGSPTSTISGVVTLGTPSFDTTTYHILDFEFRESVGGLLAYFDGVLIASATDTTYTTLGRQYLACVSNSITHDSCSARNPSVTSSTGTYYSAVHQAPSILSWNALEVNSANNGGAQTFYARSSLSSFLAQDASPAWVAQTPGTVTSISTGTYFQFRDDFSVTSGTQTPSLYDFTFNWYDAGATGNSYMIYFDNAIWESVPYGVGQSTNNYIFKYDLINDGWTLYSFGANGFLNQNGVLHIGDPLSSKIYMFGTLLSDNGMPINAYWKSKDYSGADPFLQTQLTNIDTFAKRSQGSSLVTAYAMDASTTTTTYSISLSDPLKSVVQSRKLLPSGKLGQVFNIKYSDNSTSAGWELLGYRIGFTQLPYRPTN